MLRRILPPALLLVLSALPLAAQEVVALVCRTGGEASFVFIDVKNRKVQHEGRDTDLLMTEAYYQFTFPDAPAQRIDRTTGRRYTWDDKQRSWIAGTTVCEPSPARMTTQ